jgi:hypothetical protein
MLVWLKRRLSPTSDIGNGNEIFIMKADGTHFMQVTDNFANDENPAWQP